MKTINDEDWELVYDFQRTDSWDKKSVTVKIYNHRTDIISQAIVLDDMTNKIKNKFFLKETCESDAMRWANNICNEIMFAK